jgi:hypothetical protein
MKFTPDETQRLKTAFVAYSQGTDRIQPAMIDQLICGTFQNLTFEQLQEIKKGRNCDAGFDRGQFFGFVSSNEHIARFCIAHYPPAAPEEKAPEIDALALKAEKGF